MSNGWTGGQYSLVRIALGLYLAVHFANLVPWGAERFSSAGAALLAAAVAASVLLALGLRDRWAAVFLGCVWVFLFGRSPLIGTPSLFSIGFLLLVHVCLPAAPYGSLAARGRIDPANGWRLPPRLFALTWILLAVGYSYSGLTKLDLLDGLPDGLLQTATWAALLLELLFAPLALFRRARPWLWLALLGLQLAPILLLDFADLRLGMVMLHLFTFDPAWVQGRGAQVERLFYDGSCALCQGAVRFLLAEDAEGRRFRFAPRDSEVFRIQVSAERQRSLPDSLVVVTADGRLLTRSAGVLHLLERLGGLWRVLATAARLVPRPLRDAVYNLVARTRYRIFGRKEDVCPLLPPHLRARFDL